MPRRPVVIAVVVLSLVPVGFALAQAPDVPSLEAKARDLWKSKAYVKPAGDNVVDVCKEIIKLDPTNATAADLLNKVVGILVGSGDQRLGKRDYKGAMAYYNQALELDSQSARARAGVEKAREGMERDKFEVEPGLAPEVYMAKGNELFGHGDYVRARKYYIAIMKAMPDDAFAKKRAMECEAKLGMVPAAPSKTPPQDPAARLSYYREAAAQLEKSGDWDAALSYYKQIVQAAPDDAAAKASVERAEDHAMGYGRVRLSLTGDPFFWSAKVKTAEDAQRELGITLKVLVDGKEAATYRDTAIDTLVLGEVSRNDLKLPEGFSARVTSPATNSVAVQIQTGADKPRTFGGQVSLLVGKGEIVELTVTGASTLKLGGAFGKKMSGDYAMTLKPATGGAVAP